MSPSWWLLVHMERLAVKCDPAASAVAVAAVQARYGPAAAASYERRLEMRQWPA